LSTRKEKLFSNPFCWNNARINHDLSFSRLNKFHFNNSQTALTLCNILNNVIFIQNLSALTHFRLQRKFAFQDRQPFASSWNIDCSLRILEGHTKLGAIFVCCKTAKSKCISLNAAVPAAYEETTYEAILEDSTEQRRRFQSAFRVPDRGRVFQVSAK
jgi:hypothetical protein